MVKKTYKTTNYARGRNYEYRVKKKLEKEGYTVIRSSGSHGPFDLVAFKTIPAPEIRLIQCKLGKSISENQKKRIAQENAIYKGLFNVSFEVI